MKTLSESNCSENLIDAKNRFQSGSLQVKISINEEEFGQAKQLLIDLSNINPEQELSRQTALQKSNAEHFLYDGYDSYAKHLIVKESKHNKVIAYIRIIDTVIANNIGGYFCETQFNLDKLRLQMPLAMELSHIAIAPEYNNQNTLDMLWLGLKQYAEENGIDTIFGVLSLAIENCHYSAIREINYLKSKYLSSNEYRVKPYRILPPTRAVACQGFELPDVVDYLFNRGAKLCGDASWNNILNQAELFFYIKSKGIKLSPQCVQQSEISSTGLVA
jgi:putative hemolysin